LPQTIGRLAHAIDRRLDPGDIAALRRLHSRDPSCPAFWKLLSAYVVPGGTEAPPGPLRDDYERRWAAILSGMAHMQGLHDPGRRAGRALAQVLSEARFLRLLRASGDLLLDMFRTVAQHLASKAQSIDFTGLARLVLSDDRSDQESVRRALARDYFAVARQGQTKEG
jgi:CRISPR type I-E-associated protein CasB/Cse2